MEAGTCKWWSVVSGRWSVVSGQWSVVSGQLNGGGLSERGFGGMQGIWGMGWTSGLEGQGRTAGEGRG